MILMSDPLKDGKGDIKEKMPKLVVNFLILMFSASAGIVASVVVASPFLWYANAAASDGPNFPPPLVAMFFFALPYGILLLPLQVSVMIFEFARKKKLGFILLIIGVLSGVGLGLLWLSLNGSSQLTLQMRSLVIGIAVLQAVVVFGVQFAMNNLSIRQLP